MIKQMFHDNCTLAQYMVKAKKPKRSCSNEEFIKKRKRLIVFGIEIYRFTTVVIRKGKKLEKSGKQEKERNFPKIGIAIFLAFFFAIIIEIVKVTFL